MIIVWNQYQSGQYRTDAWFWSAGVEYVLSKLTTLTLFSAAATLLGILSRALAWDDQPQTLAGVQQLSLALPERPSQTMRNPSTSRTLSGPNQSNALQAAGPRTLEENRGTATMNASPSPILQLSPDNPTLEP